VHLVQAGLGREGPVPPAREAERRVQAAAESKAEVKKQPRPKEKLDVVQCCLDEALYGFYAVAIAPRSGEARRLDPRAVIKLLRGKVKIPRRAARALKKLQNRQKRRK
jgi:hypothetical protein